MATFTWHPAPGAKRTVKPRILAARFGDGYEQRVGDGINTRLSIWELSFPGLSRADADDVDAFLVARNGVESFDWVDPAGVSGKYLCREWESTELGAGRININATFEQVAE